MSDRSALKFWIASSRLCCSLSRSISFVCSDRAFWTSLSRSLRLASMRACLSSSFSFSESKFCKSESTLSFYQLHKKVSTKFFKYKILNLPRIPYTLTLYPISKSTTKDSCIKNINKKNAKLQTAANTIIMQLRILLFHG